MRRSRSQRRSSSSLSQKCSRGQIKRKAYNRQTSRGQVHVPAKCIRATSQSGLKRSTSQKRYLAQRAKIQKEARRKFSRDIPKKCPRGDIVREGFRRKSYRRMSRGKNISVKGSWVAPTCAPSINRQKGKRLFSLERGTLEKYGYTNLHSKTSQQRHKALDSAIKDGVKPLPLLRRVNALYVLNKNKDPELAKKLHSDVAYIRNTKAYQNRETA